jgi:hypothetical protein
VAKLSTLHDAFDGDGLNTTLWNDSVGVTQTLGDGYVVLDPSCAYANFLGFTPPSRDFAEDSFTWEWTFTGAAVAGVEQYCSIGTGVSGQEIHYGRYGTSLGYFVGAEDGFEPWSDANHRWCRIRTTATDVLLESSSDGITWTNPFSFSGGGIVPLPAWDLTNVQVHFVNAFFSGGGGGDMRVHTVGVDSGSLSGSLTVELGGPTAALTASLESDTSAALALAAADAAGTGRIVSRTSLGGVLGGLTADFGGIFQSSAKDVTVSVGPTRIVHTGVGPTGLSLHVAGTIVDREP